MRPLSPRGLAIRLGHGYRERNRVVGVIYGQIMSTRRAHFDAPQHPPTTENAYPYGVLRHGIPCPFFADKAHSCQRLGR
eukprot:4386066-Amphidinium_carterae.2